MEYGCGTGNYETLIALKGYEVYGVDKSRSMLALARQKLKNSKNITLYSVDKRTLIEPGSIDLCVTLFDVLSYMNKNREIDDFFKFVKKVLVKNGLFIFDFWYGPGVENLSVEKKWKRFKMGKRDVLRLTSAERRDEDHIVNVKHEVIVFEKNRVIDRFIEHHDMRYFFKKELRDFLSRFGFKVLNFGTWENVNTLPTANDWSALIIARKA